MLANACNIAVADLNLLVFHFLEITSTLFHSIFGDATRFIVDEYTGYAATHTASGG